MKRKFQLDKHVQKLEEKKNIYRQSIQKLFWVCRVTDPSPSCWTRHGQIVDEHFSSASWLAHLRCRRLWPSSRWKFFIDYLVSRTERSKTLTLWLMKIFPQLAGLPTFDPPRSKNRWKFLIDYRYLASSPARSETLTRHGCLGFSPSSEPLLVRSLQTPEVNP